MAKQFAPQHSNPLAERGLSMEAAPLASTIPQARGRLKAAPLIWVWLLSYATLAVVNIWLWEGRGAISSELLWLEAQRRLVVDVSPPALSALIQTSRPILLYLSLLAGSALNGAALLGATAITVLAWQMRAMEAPRIWLPLLVLQPALLLAFAQHPSALARAMLITIALTSLYGYIREEATYQALVGALALGAVILADEQPWPMLFAIALILVLARRRPWRQNLTVLLITLFPAVCMILAWAYLRLVDGSATTQPAAVDLTLTYQGGPSATMIALMAGGFIAIGAWIVAAGQLFTKRDTARKDDHTWLALVLLLAIPLFDLLPPHPSREAWVLAATLPLMALPLLTQPLRRSPIAQGVIGTLLVIGLLVGWDAVERADGEPQQLVAQALGQPVTSPLAPYVAVANELNTHLAPGERVLVDSTTLAPLIPLVENTDVLLVPQQREYALALQEPSRWATYIVVTDDAVSGIKLMDYQLLLHQDGISLYQKEHTNEYER